MKGELKAGGLALVYGLTRDIEKNGRCVTLIEIATDMESAMASARNGLPPAIWWRVAGLTPDGLSRVMAKNLLPIDGDDHQEPDQMAKDKPAELTA